MRRFLVALVAAYATSLSLLAAWWGMQAWSYHRFFGALSRRHGRPIASPGVRSLFHDYGIELTLWESLGVRFADLSRLTILIMIILVFAASLIIAMLARTHPVSETERSSRVRIDPLRWTRRASLASLVIGATTLSMTWTFLRWGVLHPSPWPTVVLFVAQALAAALGFATGSWRVIRGPRRLTAISLAGAALIPLVLWGLIGLYAWSQWQQRLVPNNLPMNLAKITATSLMRLEASLEYPNRMETDRLIMFYNRLVSPRQDAQTMDRHLARLEGLLGGPLRAKVYWVRGHLPRLNQGHLSVHGIALGSGESPADWETGDGLDRHELAHAALDEYRTHDADPPYFLHEGWAESQSGVSSVVLARRALEQRAAIPSLGIRDMAGPDWYHRDDGPVYPLGGAFVDFLIRKGGVGKFVKLYNESREGRFRAVVRAVYEIDLDALEVEFWHDVRGLAARSSRKSDDNGPQP